MVRTARVVFLSLLAIVVSGVRQSVGNDGYEQANLNTPKKTKKKKNGVLCLIRSAMNKPKDTGLDDFMAHVTSSFDPDPVYTGADLKIALEITSQNLGKKIDKVKILTLGGAIGVLKHGSRPTTGDIDAVVVDPKKHEKALQKAAVAATKPENSPVHGDSHWLNFDARAYAASAKQRKLGTQFSHHYWTSKNKKIELWEPDWFFSLAQKVDKFYSKKRQAKDAKDGAAHLAEIIDKYDVSLSDIAYRLLQLLKDQGSEHACKSPKAIHKLMLSWVQRQEEY